jgi:hypothetical protein
MTRVIQTDEVLRILTTRKKAMEMRLDTQKHFVESLKRFEFIPNEFSVPLMKKQADHDQD